MNELQRIDAVGALDLLREATRRHGTEKLGTADGGIVAAALSAGGIGGVGLAALSRHDVRSLWMSNRLPCPMTLGAVTVFRRAERAVVAGAPWGDAVRHVARSARALVGRTPWVPDTSLIEAVR